MRHLGFASVVFSGCIVACGSDSTLDPPSASTSQNASLNAPGSLRASPVSPTEVDLAWQPSSTQENGFQVYRSTTGASGAYTLLASLAATARSYADVGLADLRSTATRCGRGGRLEKSPPTRRMPVRCAR